MISDSQLIFIISQPRAGSTFLQAVLSNNKNIDTISEHWMLLPFLSIYKPSLIKAKYDYKLSVDAFWGFINKSSSVEKFNLELKEFLLQQYEKILTEPGNKILDKTPRYYEIFNEIYLLFPSAKFIILKRHPIAVLKSIMTTWNRYSFKELNHQHFRDIFKAPYIIQDIYNKYGSEANCRTLFYEDFLEQPQLKTKELYEWIGIPYSEEVLDISNNDKYIGKYGDPTGVKNNKKPEKKRLHQWRNYLNNSKYKDLLNGYGHYLGKAFLEEYGYRDKMQYSPNFKFKVFKYYCFRDGGNKAHIKFFLMKLVMKYMYEEKV